MVFLIKPTMPVPALIDTLLPATISIGSISGVSNGLSYSFYFSISALY
jgi:hypothetical protein